MATPPVPALGAQAGGTYTIGTGSTPSATFPSGLTTSVSFANANASDVIDARTAITMATATSPASYSPNVGGKPGFQMPLRRGSATEGTTFVKVGTMTINFSRAVRNPGLHLNHLAITSGNSGGTVTTQTQMRITTPGVTFTDRTVGSYYTFSGATMTPGTSTASVNILGSVQLTGTFTSVAIAVDVRYRRESGTSGGAINPLGVEAAVTVDEDCSNAPSSYGAASHVLGNSFIGPNATVDNSTGLSTTACTNTSDVNDAAITFAPITTASGGQPYTVVVPISNGAGGGIGTASQVCGWIDFDLSGVFDADERACAPVDSGATTASLIFNVTFDVAVGSSWGRFRIGDPADVGNPTGMASYGEVEDYPVPVTGTGCGPGGVGTLNGLDIWLRADAGTGTTTQGAAIPAWLDQRQASPNTFTQAVPGSQPTYESSASINFNPSVRFGGSAAKWFQSNVSVNAGVKPTYDFYVVYAPDSTPGQFMLSEDDNLPSGSSFDRWISFSNGTTTSMYLSNGSGYAPQVPNGLQGTKSLMVRANWVEDASNGSGVWVNSAGGINFTANQAPETSNLLSVGAYFGGTSRYNGRIAEIIGINGTETAAAIARLESYLALKYGLTRGDVDNTAGGNAGLDYTNSAGTTIWAGSANATYQNDVAGVAADSCASLDQRVSQSVNTGDQIAIANGVYDFSGTITPTAPATAVGDQSALTWGHNNGSLTTLTAVSDPVLQGKGVTQRVSRVWRTQVTGSGLAAKASIRIPAAMVPAGLKTPVLAVSKTADFSAGPSNTYPLTLSGGFYTATADMFTAGDFFTLATTDLDYGDAPNSYGTTLASGGPSHKADTRLVLGSGASGETDARGSAAGASSDTFDDAFAVSPGANPGGAYSITPTFVNSTGAAATLAAWLDFNDNGVFDSGERQLVSVPAGATSATLTWPGSSTAAMIPGQTTYLRMRLYDGTVADPQPKAAWSGIGEVEDFAVYVADKCGYVPVNLSNGSFESPVYPAASVNYPQDATSNPSIGWFTTATDHILEYWTSGFNGVPAGAGNQFVELNATQVSTLYQDIPTLPGTPMNWSLLHRGRQGVDVMQLRIGPPSGPLLAQTPTGEADNNIDDGNTAWGAHRGLYIVPAGQTVTRFAFVSVSSAGGNQGIGNFLDGISFGPPGCLLTTKTVAGPNPATVGDTLTYTISSNNPGSSATLNSFINDVIPAGSTFVPGSIKRTDAAGTTTSVADADGYTGSGIHVAIGGSLTAADGGMVAAGTTWKVSFQVKVAANTGTTIVNNATSEWIPYTGATKQTSSAATTTSPVSAADLVTTKAQVGSAPVTPGTTFDYAITVTNNGPSAAVNAKATDTLPLALSFVSSVDGCTAVGQTVSCGPVATLASGAAKTWVIKVKLDPGYTGNGSDLGNVAVGSNDIPDPNPTNNSNPPARPSAVASAAADLSTVKAAKNTAPVTPGTTFDWAVTVTNNGPSAAVNVRASDVLPMALSFVSSVDGCTAAGQTVSCGPVATLAVGASKTWTFTVKLDAGYTGNGSDIGNVAVSRSDTPDPSPSNNGNPTARPSVGPAAADLSTVKVAKNTAPVTPGTTFDWAVTVTNNGPSAAVNVRASDVLPMALSFVSSVDGCTAAGQTVSCGPVATLAVGASKTWTFTVKLDAGYTGNGSDLGNVAVSQSDTPDPSPSNNGNPTARPSVGPASADVVTAKVAKNTAPVTPGTTFDWAVTATNNGPSAAVNVRVSDVLPAPLTFVSSADGCTAAGQNVSCGPVASLAVGASKTWTFTVKLDAGYTGDGSDLGNVAVSQSDTPDPSPSNNGNPTARPSVGPAAADLTTSKVAKNTAPVTPGTTFDWAITVTNNGPSVAVNARATDALPTALTFVSSVDGCTAAGQTVSCGPVASLAVGASKTWTFTVKLDAGYTGNGSDLGNVAVSQSDTPDPSPSNNSNPTARPSVGPAAADLTTSKVAKNTAPVTPGTTFDWAITVTNNGPSVAVNARATDTLPTALSFVSSVDGCTAAGQTVSCGPVASLAVGASKTWTFTVKLDAGYTGDGSDLGNVAVSQSDTPDPSPSNNSNPTARPSVGPAAADLTTSKVAKNTASVTPGTTFDWAITVTNNGPSVAVNARATDALPAPLTFVSSVDGCTAAGQTVTCGPVATLAVGASKTWTFTVRLDAGYTGNGSDLGNVAVSQSDTPDPSPSNNGNPTARPSVGPAAADLTTSKVAKHTAPVTPGTTFDWAVTVTNNGPSTAVNVKATDDLATPMSFVSSVDGCTAVGQTVSCGPVATLAVGASKTWAFTVKLDAGYTGDGSDLGNVAVSQSDTPDPSPSNNGNPTSNPSVGPAAADLVTAKVAKNTAPVTPGTAFDWAVTVTNNGPSVAVNVKATDDLATPMSFVSSVDGCTAAGQTVSCGPVATLAVGASKTWTFTVKLDAGYTGDGSDIGNVAVSDSDTPDPSPSNNGNPTANPSVGPAAADLVTAKVARNSSPVTPGTTFDWAITVTNNGPSAAVNVKATDDLATPLTFVSSVDGCTAVGQMVSCGPEATLAVGASKTWTFTVKLDAGYSGDGSDLGNVAVSQSDTPDPSPSNNSNPTAQPSAGPAAADLVTAKVAKNSSPVTPGTTFDWAVTVTNNGPSVAVNVKATDDLATPMGFVSSVDGCTAAGQTVSCGPVASLAVGASKTWTFTVKLDAGYTGDGSDLGNVAVTQSDTPDPSPSNNSNPTSNPSVGPAAADLTTVKVAKNTAPVTPGTAFDWAITVTNNGPSTAVNVKATDDLAMPMSFVSSVDGCTAAGQTVTCGPEAVLVVGASKTWTFTVMLDAGYTGDGSDLGNVAVSQSDTPDPSPSNNGNPTSEPSIGPAAADLTTVKVAKNTAPVAPGTTFDWAVTVMNGGPSTAVNVKATDSLATPMSFVSSVDGCTAAGQTVSCGPVATLAVGASKTWTFTVMLDAGYTGDGSDLGNVAVSGSDTPDPSPSNNGNPTANPSIGPASADLTTSKVATNTAPVTPGTTFDWAVTVTNGGPSVAANVKAMDSLATPMGFVSSVDGCTASGQVVTCGPVAALAVGASKTWTFTVKLDAGYTGDGSDLGNVAVSDSDTPDPAPSNNSNPTAQPSIGPASADLATTKVALNPVPVTPGTTFDWAVTVTNNGPSTAANVNAVDNLPTALSFVSSVDGCTAAGQVVTCGPVATLAVGASKTWTFTVKLDAGYTGDGSDIGNVAVSGSDTPDPSPSNNGNPTAKPSVGPASADLATTKVALNPAPVIPGTTFDWAITVTNSGPSVAVNVKTTDDLPIPLTFVSSSDGCTAAGQVVTCGPVATLAVGASKTWTFTVKLDAGYHGNGSDLGNVAVSQSDTPDPSPSNNIAPTATPSGGTPLLFVDKTESPASPKPGDKVTYKVVLSNVGTADYPGATFTDDLTDVLDDATFDNDQSDNGAGGTLTYSAPNLTWTGTVHKGGSVTVTYSATIGNPPAGNSSLTNTVVSTINTNCGNGSSDQDCRPVTKIPRLHVVKTAQPMVPRAGDKITYTIAVVNDGTADYVGAVVTDDLTDVLDDATFDNDQSDNGAGGTLTYSEPMLTWTGDVARGTTVNLTFSVTLIKPGVGGKMLRNQVVANGSNCTAGSTDPACKVAVPAPPFDFGDAPDSYGTTLANNGAFHQIVPWAHIGTTVQEENDGHPSANADADTSDDGVTSFPPLDTDDSSYSLKVDVLNNGDSAATLAGWIDFDRNGSFDAGEMAQTSVAAAAANTTATLTWGVSGAKAGLTFVRLRLYASDTEGATGPAGLVLASREEKMLLGSDFGLSPKGFGGPGEVEDHAMIIDEAPPLPVTGDPVRRVVLLGGVLTSLGTLILLGLALRSARRRNVAS